MPRNDTVCTAQLVASVAAYCPPEGGFCAFKMNLPYTHPHMLEARWTQIETLFDGALEQPESEREAWLRAACPDENLRQEVARLVRACEKSADFLEAPLRPFPFEEVIRPEARRVGPYQLISEISRGGMGVVYLAERADGHYEQRVAIKLVRRALDSPNLRRRFAAERQILASLSHPNVARLLDGGITDEGQPYLVLAYVDGQPITRYCDERTCTLEERLQLFVTVCQTVHHAHQKLIVHRDLKPSNIFVTAEGEVKLLDFGIAKLLGEDGMSDVAETHTGVRLMTPEYASPEQVQSGEIGTASDVYQLGLLLYELLAGVRAQRLETAGLEELVRVVVSQDPPPPSRAARGEKAPGSRRIAGDLDAITMTALRKAPEERYASASEFAEDVRRYLEGRPVRAHAASLPYRLKKFVRRNRMPVAAASLVLLLLIAYAVTVTVQERKTARERVRAEQYARLLTQMFSDVSPFDSNEIGPETTLRTFLELSTQRIRGETESDPDLRASLLQTIADVQQELGATEEARALFEEVMPYWRGRHGVMSNPYLDAHQRYISIADSDGNGDSLHHAHLALVIEHEHGEGPRTAKALLEYGRYLYGEGRLEEALEVLSRGRTMINHATPSTAISILYFMANSLHVLDRLDEAEAVLEVALASARAHFGDRHPQTAVVMTLVASTQEARGDYEAALPWTQNALEILQEKLGPQHPYAVAQLNNLGVLYGYLERRVEEESTYREVLAWREAELGPMHPETIGTAQNLASSLLHQDRLQEAEPILLEVAERYEASLPENHYLRAFPHLSLADLYARRSEHAQSEAAAREAVLRLAESLPPDHALIAVAEGRLGAALARQGRVDEAEPLLLRADTILAGASGFSRYRSEVASALAVLRGRE